MKIAITSMGEDLKADVDPRLGRTKNFIIVDTDTMQYEVISNFQNINSPSGAGIQAAQTIAKTKSELVITGNCGPKAFAVLAAAKIKLIIGVSGSIEEVLDNFKEGKLKIVDSANVEGHWV